MTSSFCSIVGLSAVPGGRDGPESTCPRSNSGLVGLARGETARLNVVNLFPRPVSRHAAVPGRGGAGVSRRRRRGGPRARSGDASRSARRHRVRHQRRDRASTARSGQRRVERRQPVGERRAAGYLHRPREHARVVRQPHRAPRGLLSARPVERIRDSTEVEPRTPEAFGMVGLARLQSCRSSTTQPLPATAGAVPPPPCRVSLTFLDEAVRCSRRGDVAPESGRSHARPVATLALPASVALASSRSVGRTSRPRRGQPGPQRVPHRPLRRPGQHAGAGGHADRADAAHLPGRNRSGRDQLTGGANPARCNRSGRARREDAPSPSEHAEHAEAERCERGVGDSVADAVGQPAAER